MAEKTKKKMGRPTTYSKKVAEELCFYLAQGKSLRTVCDYEGMPHLSTVFRWFQIHPDFCEQYARAKQESADAMAEEILDIADDGTNDWMTIETKGGFEKEVPNNEVLQRSRLRVDTRKWLMAKMKPKKYGERIDMTSNGKTITAPPIIGMEIIYEPNRDSTTDQN